MKQIFESDIKQYLEKTIRVEFDSARDFKFDFYWNFVTVDFYYDRPWNFWMFGRIQGTWNKLQQSSVFPNMAVQNMWVDGSHITLQIYFNTDKNSIFN